MDRMEGHLEADGGGNYMMCIDIAVSGVRLSFYYLDKQIWKWYKTARQEGDR